MTYDESLILAISTTLKRQSKSMRALVRQKTPEHRDRSFKFLAEVVAQSLRESSLPPDDC